MTNRRTPAGNRIEKTSYGDPQHDEEAVVESYRYGDPQHETEQVDPQEAEHLGYEDRGWDDPGVDEVNGGEGPATARPRGKTGTLA